MQIQNLDQGRYNYNHATERDIGFSSKYWRIKITKKLIPKQLWDLGLVYEDQILSIMSRSKGK